MARKPKTERVPRTRAGGEWTEASFWSFLRSGLRQLSRRWPPLTRLAANAVRRAYTGPNKRQKWEYECAKCHQWFKADDIQVDHIEPCGSLKSNDDIGPFVARLFVETDALQVLCDTCHQNKTNGVESPWEFP